jgi:hypothetical protein
VLAEQVEQRRLDRGDDVDGGAQVEGLQAAAAGIAVGEALAHRAQHVLHVADRPRRPPASRGFLSVWRIFSPPGTSPTPVRPASSVAMTQVAGEERAVGAARFISIESRPATGITRSDATLGAAERAMADSWCARSEEFNRR